MKFAPVIMINTLLFVLCFSLKTFAKDLNVEVAFGSPEASMRLTDQEAAKYQGVSIQARTLFALFSNDDMGMFLSLGFRNTSLSNNSNSNSQTEEITLYGPSVGLNFQVTKFVFGANYYNLKAKHLWVGDVNDKNEYEFPVLTSHIGVEFKITNNFVWSVVYSQGNSEIKAEDIKLNRDVEYSEKTIWLNFNYDTQAGFWNLMGRGLK